MQRLSTVLAQVPSTRSSVALPKPTRSLDVEHIAVVAPNGKNLIVGDVNFQLVAGEVLAVLGPSGAGKTSLVRNLIGVWRPARGKVRLDGGSLDQWDEEALGKHIGFVSQSVEFFDASIAENIARMSLEPDGDAILDAGRAANAHDMILRLPAGYDTRIGDASTALSAGQCQRIALARALYGNPFLVVLDEPNSNLDSEGDIALQNAIRGLKARGAIVVIIAHRPTILEQCDKVLILANGVQQAFGPRDTILRKVPVQPAARPAAAAGGGNLTVLRDPNAGVGP
jgi:ABC-type protease/lipase transport system fused ATPase/permease subunit